MTTQSQFQPDQAILEPDLETVGGKVHWRGNKGELIPAENVPAKRQLEDETVRKIVAFGKPLSAQIARFRQHAFDDVDRFVALVDQDYNAKRGGRKGNLTLTSVNGLFKVEAQYADLISFGPELQSAKALIDECLAEWSADAIAPLRAVVHNAFNVEKGGLINKAELMRLKTYEISDERWQRAMTAIDDSIRVVGTKRYVRIYARETLDDEFVQIPINAARA